MGLNPSTLYRVVNRTISDLAGFTARLRDSHHFSTPRRILPMTRITPSSAYPCAKTPCLLSHFRRLSSVRDCWPQCWWQSPALRQTSVSGCSDQYVLCFHTYLILPCQSFYPVLYRLCIFHYSMGRCEQKQCRLRGLLCRWPSLTEWEMHITAQGPLSPKWPILCRVGC